jgi:hypothetical protein
MSIHVWSLLKVIAVVERNTLENDLAHKFTRIVDSHSTLPISKKIIFNEGQSGERHNDSSSLELYCGTQSNQSSLLLEQSTCNKVFKQDHCLKTEVVNKTILPFLLEQYMGIYI